jgi:glycosyltransferase involved in cell wall biosynthesis
MKSTHTYTEPARERIAMLVENNPYPQDVRVRSEAQSLVRAGHDVTVVAPRDPSQSRREIVNGVRVIRYRIYDGSTRGAPGFILEYLIAFVWLHVAAIRALMDGSTVLHLHNPPDIFFPAGLLYRLCGRKVIFDHHDLFPETVSVKFGSPRTAAVARLCQRLTFAVAHHVIATNASYAQVALNAGRKPPEAVTIVRNGPPSEWSRMPANNRPGVLDEVHLVYLGAISSQDGVDGLVPVMQRLCDGGLPGGARLTVVGDGDERAPLEAAFAALGLGDRVTFTGRVPAKRVPELLQTADICVDTAPPTDVNERSTMTKIAEYMSLGKPVVAYDLLETQRTTGDAAVLAPRGDANAFADAIVALARDPERRTQVGERARLRAAAHLTWDQSALHLTAAYAALRSDGVVSPELFEAASEPQG